MAKEYNKDNIKNTYFTIAILDDCFNIHGEIYDEITGVHCPQTLLGCARKVVEMKNHDKELGAEYGKWDYRIIRHEEDDDSDWQTAFKVYKYRNQWKVKPDYKF